MFKMSSFNSKSSDYFRISFKSSSAQNLSTEKRVSGGLKRELSLFILKVEGVVNDSKRGDSLELGRFIDTNI